MIGKKFYSWTIIEGPLRNKFNQLAYKVRCICGIERLKTMTILSQGINKQCDKCQLMSYKKDDHSGEKIHDWTLLTRILSTDGKKQRYRAQCSCNAIQELNLCEIKNNRSTKCRKCASKIRNQCFKTHGLSYTKIYYVWRSMIARCTNKKMQNYKYYGGRGISVCDRWIDSFENFYEDMGNVPLGKTIDRINVDGNYEKCNCRWATKKEQANNKRPR